MGMHIDYRGELLADAPGRFHMGEVKERKFPGWTIVVLALGILVLSLCFMPARALANDSALSDGTSSDDSSSTDSSAVQINYDGTTGIHSATVDGSNVILYCMNNQYHWPHYTEMYGSAPSYVLGYLTEGMFDSVDDYNACMDKISAILYAGYPYNGLRMYEIGSFRNITEDEYNAKLNAPSQLREDYSETLGDATFTYSDWANNNTENLDKLRKFLVAVGDLYPSGTTASGLTYREIISTDFYNAAMLMVSYSGDPLTNWDQTHSEGYYVTEEQAYWATQDAIWVTLTQYRVKGNDLKATDPDVVNNQLAGKLLNVDMSAVMTSEPDAGKVQIQGSTEFTHNLAAGVWKTGELRISEPLKYNGRYTLMLPDGVVAVNENGDEISTTDMRADQDFYLQTTTEPTSTVTITATVTLHWVEKAYEYSPTGTASDGSQFQHMTGIAVGAKAVSATHDIAPAPEGSLVTKKDEGNATDNNDNGDDGNDDNGGAGDADDNDDADDNGTSVDTNDTSATEETVSDVATGSDAADASAEDALPTTSDSSVPVAPIAALAAAGAVVSGAALRRKMTM